jgi:hypothetical protein
VIDRVHSNTASLRTNALPTVTTGLTDFDEFVFGVTDFANSCAAIEKNATHFC